MGVEAMTLCAGCNYPIPSWQHNGACKPVAEKVPRVLDADWAERIVTAKRARRVTEIRTETPTARTETPEAVRKSGRPKKWATEAERLAAYRARKQG